MFSDIKSIMLINMMVYKRKYITKNICIDTKCNIHTKEVKIQMQKKEKKWGGPFRRSRERKKSADSNGAALWNVEFKDFFLHLSCGDSFVFLPFFISWGI